MVDSRKSRGGIRVQEFNGSRVQGAELGAEVLGVGGGVAGIGVVEAGGSRRGDEAPECRLRASGEWQHAE
jgi:hypothetical protein